MTWWNLIRRLRRTHRPIRSFQHALHEARGVASTVDRGVQAVSVNKIIGSVGRWQNLRSDFLYRTGKAMTERYYRVSAAMVSGKMLPALDLYKLRWPTSESGEVRPSEYYVVDGHHRVAMARRLGQVYLDAHVTEYLVANQRTVEPVEAQTESRPLRRAALLSAKARNRAKLGGAGC